MTEFQVIVYDGVNDGEEVLDDMLLEEVADSRHFCHLQLFQVIKLLLLAPDVLYKALQKLEDPKRLEIGTQLLALMHKRATQLTLVSNSGRPSTNSSSGCLSAIILLPFLLLQRLLSGIYDV